MTGQPSRPEPGSDRAAAIRALARIWARTRRGATRPSWSIRRRLAVATSAAGVLLIAGCLAGSVALSDLIGAVNVQVNRIDPASRYGSGLLAALLGQETGVRGYVLTAQRPFLQPYRAGGASAEGYVAALRPLVRPYPGLRSELGQVVADAKAWQRTFADPAIAAVRAHGRSASVDEVAGQQLFDALRESVARLSARLQAERQWSLHRLHRDLAILIALTAAGTAGLVAMTVASWAGLRAWVTVPLVRLGREAQTVASGQIEHRLQVTGPLEVANLATDLEAMRRQLLFSLDEVAGKAAELERSNHELEQFAYVASHDLQEPLRKVTSFCQLLEARYQGQLDERADQYIGYAVDGAKRMQILINELLAFSRVGRQPRGFGHADLNIAADQAVANLSAAIEDSGAEIAVDELPAVHGDISLLTQLFQNLLSNAIKFRQPGEPPKTHIGFVRNGGECEFSIADNGIGIAAEYAERVFTIFQRLHAREAYPGTGIGLALCRKIVDFHGGRIWIDTSQRAGPGTIVRWTLPVPQPASEEA